MQPRGSRRTISGKDPLRGRDPGDAAALSRLDREIRRPGDARLAQVAADILKRRRERTREFSSSFFGEPAWEMLLELYVRESFGVSSTIAQLKPCLQVRASTLLRSLHRLADDGLVARMAHPLHDGTEFVELTARARQALERYLAAAQSE